MRLKAPSHAKGKNATTTERLFAKIQWNNSGRLLRCIEEGIPSECTKVSPETFTIRKIS